MRRICLGVPLEVIALDEGVEVKHLKSIIDAPLFKQELAKMQEAVDVEVTQKAAELAAEKDPIISRLRRLVPQAVNRIGSEMDNFDPESGATATSRLQAAKMIIEMEGTYAPKKDSGPSNPTIVLNFSPAKIAAIQAKRGMVIDVPQEAPAT